MPEDLQVLTNTIIDVWTHGLLGVDIGQIIIALLILTFFLLIRGLFGKFILSHLKKLTQKSVTTLDDKIVDALIPPIKFIPIILGVFFASQYLNLSDDANAFVIQIERSLIVFTIFWALHRTCTPLSYGFKKLEEILTKAMIEWIFKVPRVRTH